MSDVVLGKIPPANSERDAIHVAVIPMEASETLRPGQRVGIISPGVAGPTENVVGIVDPFMFGPIQKGGRFWLALLPNTVTGMRHHWRHPDFVAEPAIETAGEYRKADAENWLRGYASRVNIYDDNPERAFERLISGLREQELFFHGTDLHGLYELEEADELKRNAEIYLGHSIDFGRFGFSCSC